MTWNYRIIKHRGRLATYYGLHEVYYRTNKRKKTATPYLWDAEPEIIGESPKEIAQILSMMLRDALKDAPVMRKSEMPGQKKKGTKD